MSEQNPLVLAILQSLENICQQSYLAQATTGVPSLSYPQYRLKFLREVIGLLAIEVSALERRLGSQQVVPEAPVQQPELRPIYPDIEETSVEQERGIKEPEPDVGVVKPVTPTVTKEQQLQPITQEQANALKQELAQLESDIENRKSILSQSALAMLEARREEIKAQLNSPIVSSQQTQAQQPVVQQSEPKLGLFESRRLKNLQSDLKRVQEAYAKRQQDRDFTPELDQKYQARIQQLQADIDKILKKTT